MSLHEAWNDFYLNNLCLVRLFQHELVSPSQVVGLIPHVLHLRRETCPLCIRTKRVKL